MPVRWTVDHQARFVRATAEGLLTAAEVRDYLDGVAAAGAMPYAKLFDVTGADSLLSFDDLAALGSSIRQYAVDSMGRLGPLAIVVGESQALQAARFADTSVSNRPLRIFRDHQQAEAWLEQILER